MPLRGVQGASFISALANQTDLNEKTVRDGCWRASGNALHKNFSWGRFLACVNGHSCTKEKETIWVQLSIITLHFCFGTLS